MSNQFKILAPRRGSKSTMSVSPGKDIVLAEGEVFIENDTTNNIYRIKVGDGSTKYEFLPYDFSGTAEDVKFNPGSSGMVSTNVEDAIIEAANSGGGGGGSAGIFYGTCTSNADASAKTVTVSNIQGFSLKVGATVMVKFTNDNTAANVTLNVNGTGAYSIYYNTSVYTGTNTKMCGKSNALIVYSYDGTNWVWIGHSEDNDTTYSTVSTASAGLAPQVTNVDGYLKGDGTWSMPSGSSYSEMTVEEMVEGIEDDPRVMRADYLKAGVDAMVKDSTGTIFYGTCDTAADTATKVVNVTDTNFKLVAGAIIIVKYSITNTAENVTLNVNNTGNVSIWYNASVYTGTSNIVTGYAGRNITYVYDGTYWSWISSGYDSNTTYSVMTSAQLIAGTDTTNRSMRADYTKAGVNSLIDTKIAAINNVSTASAGFAPKVTSTDGYLKGDGTWTVPPNDNTTYSISGGTNKITVTPSSGDAYDVTVIPSISNNITGSGTRTSGYLSKNSGTSSITNGPQLGAAASTMKFLKGDGTWDTPANDNTTYTISGGTNQITVTPSTGSAYDVAITPSIPTVTSAAAGLVPSGGTTAQYLNGGGTWSDAVLGVKGDNESTYRTGNVNITAANVKALPLAGGTLTGNIVVNKNSGSASTARTVSQITLGNNVAVGTTGNACGRIVFYGEGIRYAEVLGTNITANTKLEMPSGTTGTIAVTSDIDTKIAAIPTVTTAVNGLAPKITNTSGYLKGDGTWDTPQGTTYAEGLGGLVPTSGAANTKYLRGDGLWQTPPYCTTQVVTSGDITAGTATATRAVTAKNVNLAVNSLIDTKIAALDGTVSGTAGAGKTLTAFSQTDGKVSATFGNISITESQISNFATWSGTKAQYDAIATKVATTLYFVN